MMFYAVMIVHVSVMSTKLKLTRCIFICLSTATNLHFGQSHLNSKVRKTIPGWNDFVLDAKATASDAHQLWCQWNKPRNGPVFDLMQRTRAQYKYAIRYCRHHEKQIQADTLASHLSRHNFSSFWHKVSTLKSPGLSYPSKVGPATGPGTSAICGIKLFSTVSVMMHIQWKTFLLRFLYQMSMTFMLSQDLKFIKSYKLCVTIRLVTVMAYVQSTTSLLVVIFIIVFSINVLM